MKFAMMVCRNEYLFAIGFCLTITVVRYSEGVYVFRHPAVSDNDSTRNLTCVSEDDDAALIWNYNPKVSDTKNEQNCSFTNFEPKKPGSKNIGECGIWNGTKCLVEWEDESGWGVVDSFQRPMGPVFDYRWEDFEEFVSDKHVEDQKYRYVGKMKPSHGTAVFSVRGLRDIWIFLCQKKHPIKRRSCFWIVLGGSRGQRSAIKSCFAEAAYHRKSPKEGNCVEIAKALHRSERIVDAYEWRTFVLEWSEKKRSIRVYKENEAEPFLEGKVDRWHRVSHLHVQSDIASRVRFHFYEYHLAERNNAFISTKEFVHRDNKICVDLFVGLCPKCKLTVTLVDDRGEDIPVAIISGGKKSAHGKLVAWRSVRLNTTLPNFNPRLVKLRIVTAPETDQVVKGFWAIDNFRTCKSVAGLRQSTITTRREMLPTILWPMVNCQKLSYTENSVANLHSSYPDLFLAKNRKHLYEVTPKIDQDRAVARRSVPAPNENWQSFVPGFTLIPETSRGILLSRRKTRSLDNQNNSNRPKLEIYKINRDRNTISIRLSPLQSARYEASAYKVFDTFNTTQSVIHNYEVSEGLECALWDDSVCFEEYSLPDEWKDVTIHKIKVEMIRNGMQLHTMTDRLEISHTKQSSEPTNLNIINKGKGIVTVTWQHPRLPYREITEFVILVWQLETKLSGFQVTDKPTTISYPVTKEQKKYSMELHLLTSTEYKFAVAVSWEGTKSDNEASDTKWIPSGVAFADGEELRITEDEVSINLEPPEVVNATLETSIDVIVQGNLSCTSNLSPTSTPVNTTDWHAAHYTIAEYKLEDSIVIGGNRSNKTTLNCVLHPGETYIIEVRVIDGDSDDPETSSRSSDTVTSTWIFLDSNTDQASRTNEEYNPVWIVVIPIAAILIIFLFIWYRKRKNASTKMNEPEILSSSNIHLSRADYSAEQPTPSSESANYKSSSPQLTPDVIPDDYAGSHPVKVEDFEEYIKESLASGLLDSQYEKFPRGLHKPCKYGTLPDNVPKNRYKDTTAYDHSRVVLDKVDGDRHSDYINANYIQGYNKKRAYIAAQGPTAKTVRDFWRMIWQKEVRVICMLANVKEGGKTKCEKYWPEVGTNAKYGDVIITNIKHEVFADYTFRKFRLDCKKAQRNVTHLHYTGWPDHGVPMYTQSLVSYLKKLQDTDTGDGPVVIHCSAGVGRTGTIILCDVCLNQANATKMIDVPTVMAKMREDRATMVDNKQQYLLAHLTIVESILPASTQLPCDGVLEAEIEKLRAQLPSDIQRLNDTVWQDRALHSLAAPKRAEDVVENRMSNRGYQSEAESQFSSTIDTEDDKINAVSVDGVKMKRQYLALGLPSLSTLPEFWKLIAEKRIELIVILQQPEPGDPKFCDILPTEPVTTPVPHIQVEAKILPIKDDYFSINKLFLIDSSREEVKPQPVTVLTCTGWVCRKEGNPPTVAALVSLWRASEKISRKESPTLVLCCNGVTGCGLYLALSFLLDRMAVERECDVISAVRAVRRSNPAFVQKLVQFQYLYDGAVNFFKCFDNYSNFS